MVTHGSKKILDENQDDGIWPKIGQALRRRAPILPDCTSDIHGQHPWWFVVILTLIEMTSISWWLFRIKKWGAGILCKIGQAFKRLKDTGYMCLVGIEKLAPLCFVIAVLVPHFLLLPFWDLYLFKGFPSVADGKIPITTLIHQAIFVIASLLLAFAFHILDSRLKKTDPEADLITSCLEYVTQRPPGLRIISGFAAYFILGVGYVILYSLFFLCGIYILLFSFRLFGWLRMLLILSYNSFKGMSSHILEVLESMKVRTE